MYHQVAFFVFLRFLQKNSFYFLIQHSLICLCNGNTRCSVWVMNWMFVQDNAKGYVQKKLVSVLAVLIGSNRTIWIGHGRIFSDNGSCLFQAKFLTWTYPITGLDRTLGLEEFEVPRISRQSVHESGKFVSPMHRPPLPHTRNPRYSCLLEAEWTSGS